MPRVNGHAVGSTDSDIRNITGVLMKVAGHVANFKSEISKGLDAGANDYITKPFDPDQLLSLMEKYLNE